MLEVLYPLDVETRRYSLKNAPLRRQIYAIGETVASEGHLDQVVQEVTECKGLIYYSCTSRGFWEYELTCQQKIDADSSFLEDASFSRYQLFDLRESAWRLQSKVQQNYLASMLSAKVDILAHQIYLANEVLSKPRVRALLSDEVGLGKTVEAGLIYAGLRARQQANSVLIVVPDSLVHQWASEIYEKFGDLFAVRSSG